jgi:hypothetical protein
VTLYSSFSSTSSGRRPIVALYSSASTTITPTSTAITINSTFTTIHAANVAKPPSTAHQQAPRRVTFPVDHVLPDGGRIATPPKIFVQDELETPTKWGTQSRRMGPTLGGGEEGGSFGDSRLPRSHFPTASALRYVPLRGLLVASRLDSDVNTAHCRIAFYGRLVDKVTSLLFSFE